MTDPADRSPTAFRHSTEDAADTTTAEVLAQWANSFDVDQQSTALARRSLVDTVVVAIAGAAEPVVGHARILGEAGQWATAAHVLDFDDLHLPSTSHISAVIVPTVLSVGGRERAYLAGAGAMARLGTMLGWDHYRSGWHSTCTAGAPAAAIAAGVSMGLSADELAHAVALAVSGAGGVQRSFGTDAKSLQVGLAADAGTRAAHLAADGARANLRAVEQWLTLLGGSPAKRVAPEPAVPGGLAVKLYPCCYALQRPIAAMRLVADDVDPSMVSSIRIATPRCTVQPLIDHLPATGLEAKFSLEYALATTLLDSFPTLESFEDAAVNRPEARRLMRSVSVELVDDPATGLLAGSTSVSIGLRDGTWRSATVETPPGAPQKPPSPVELAHKTRACGIAANVERLDFATASEVLRHAIGQKLG